MMSGITRDEFIEMFGIKWLNTLSWLIEIDVVERYLKERWSEWYNVVKSYGINAMPEPVSMCVMYAVCEYLKIETE